MIIQQVKVLIIVIENKQPKRTDIVDKSNYLFFACISNNSCVSLYVDVMTI